MVPAEPTVPDGDGTVPGAPDIDDDGKFDDVAPPPVPSGANAALPGGPLTAAPVAPVAFCARATGDPITPAVAKVTNDNVASTPPIRISAVRMLMLFCDTESNSRASAPFRFHCPDHATVVRAVAAIDVMLRSDGVATSVADRNTCVSVRAS